jgi:quinol monooxygenase YgiN
MVTRGLIVRLHARSGMGDAVEGFLRAALPMAMEEKTTQAWFALRFGRLDYGIFDAFLDETGRDAHLNGLIAQELAAQGDKLFDPPPRIEKCMVLASKLTIQVPPEPVTKGLLLSFKPKTGHEAQVEQFLLSALPLVQQESRTTAWFALHLDDGQFGIFDVFPDNAGRFAHLTGHVPRELAKHALSLLGGLPDMQMLDVLAAKVSV